MVNRGAKVMGGVAQLGERYNGIVEVRGSIPLASTPTTGWKVDRLRRVEGPGRLGLP